MKLIFNFSWSITYTYNKYKVVFNSSETESCSVMSDSLRHRNSPGQNTGMGSRSLLQGIFPTQGSKPGLPHCRWILYQLSHKGSPRILEWVAYPFSSGSSWPRNQTGVFNSRALHLVNIPMKIALTWRNMWLVTKDRHVLLCRHYLLPRGSQRHYFYEQRLIFAYFGT